MADIARRAGLAVQTVSYFFGTKPRLLSALLQATIEATVAEATPDGTARWNELRPEPRQVLTSLITSSTSDTAYCKRCRP